jgi:serine/threonine protein kinase
MILSFKFNFYVIVNSLSPLSNFSFYKTRSLSVTDNCDDYQVVISHLLNKMIEDLESASIGQTHKKEGKLSTNKCCILNAADDECHQGSSISSLVKSKKSIGSLSTDSTTVRSNSYMRRLSEGLIGTYQKINEIYYAKKQAAKKQALSSSLSCTTLSQQWFMLSPKLKLPFGFALDISNGGILVGKVSLLEELGKGTFGRVFAGDFQPQGSTDLFRTAIKISNMALERDVRTDIIDFTKNEDALLTRVRELDPEDKSCIIKRIQSGHLLINNMDVGQYCLVLEKASMNLLQLLRKTQGTGLSLRLTAKLAHQILRATAFLNNDMQVIHADIKPENIVLMKESNSAIKLIDLGNTIPKSHSKEKGLYLVTRFYRAPEITLMYDEITEGIDSFSLGCVLFEIFCGQPLFPAQNSTDLILMIEELLGPMPSTIALQCPKNDKYLKPSITQKDCHELTLRSSSKIKWENRLEYFNRKLTVAFKTRYNKGYELFHTQETIGLFKDLLIKLIGFWNPRERLNSLEALQHPFFLKINEICCTENTKPLKGSD